MFLEIFGGVKNTCSIYATQTNIKNKTSYRYPKYPHYMISVHLHYPHPRQTQAPISCPIHISTICGAPREKHRGKRGAAAHAMSKLVHLSIIYTYILLYRHIYINTLAGHIYIYIFIIHIYVSIGIAYAENPHRDHHAKRERRRRTDIQNARQGVEPPRRVFELVFVYIYIYVRIRV